MAPGVPLTTTTTTTKPQYFTKLTVPADVRHPQCQGELDVIRNDLHSLPTTSVVFCFCNEPQSSLYHSIHSVIERSPPELLKEIILVDDGSNADHIMKPLEDYVATLPVTGKYKDLHRIADG